MGKETCNLWPADFSRDAKMMNYIGDFFPYKYYQDNRISICRNIKELPASSAPPQQRSPSLRCSSWVVDMLCGAGLLDCIVIGPDHGVCLSQREVDLIGSENYTYLWI